MTDHGDRLVLLEELAHEPDGRRHGAETVGVRDAAGQNQPVVVVPGHVIEHVIDRELVGLVEMVEPLDGTILDSDQLDHGPSLPGGIDRFGQFHLLDTVGRQRGYALSLENVHALLLRW